MATQKLLAFAALLSLSACFNSTREPDCLLEGTCECKLKADCRAGSECVNGKCFEVIDAGRPGEQGWPCTQDSECLFGPCLTPGPGNGRVCSAACAVDGGLGCEKGWDCKQAPTGQGFLCAPPIRVQCLECTRDSDCNTIGDRCTRIGNASFCTTDCALTGQCPLGNVCRSVTLDGGAARQCFPQSNTCECSAVSAGLTRACKRTNLRATCFGVETCEPNGNWNGCDALEASAEVCDGIDNDCDGLTDQPDPDLVTTGLPSYPDCRKGLTCTGLFSCRAQGDGGFAFSCSAPDPKPELCNGADDDCNGRVDDGLVDSTGAYVSPRACGTCATDCFKVLRNLAEDGGVVIDGAATCDSRGGQRECVPRICAKGSYLSPPGAPQICEKAESSQCRPCTTSGDCRVPGDECVNMGTDPDTFCAQSCAPDSVLGACPTGNTCQSVNGKRLCVPDGNSCQCNTAHVGFSRSCFVTAGAATCIGNQTCSAQGTYGSCDTSMTSLEFCDGRDNDCDLVVDDGFINTRGTGTYDTDAHCAACNNNCGARWSPTIQHAIGGCSVLAAPPKCVIASCTTERVGGGAVCRLDSECTGGAVCHPTYRQCVRSCTTNTQCRGNEQCTSGFCTRGCSTAADCTPSFGPSAICTSGTCGITYQFVNADVDESNGCECASNPAVIDEPERYAAYPTAGLPYVDRDCDQIDGVASRSLFVWAQSTTSLGTRAAPYRTIAEAITAFRPGGFDSILVAQGTYAEQVVLTNGVQLFGGYSADFTRRDIILLPTFIEASQPSATQRRGTVNAEGLTQRTIISGFTIRGYDVNSRPMPGVPATNSYAIYVRDSAGLIIQNNHVVGGRGGDGSPAFPGLAGVNGAAGQNGVPARECNSTDCIGETQSGGIAGVNAACSAPGQPGAGTDLNLDPQAYGMGGGFNGNGGSNATYRHSDPSQTAFCKYDCTVPGQGLAGGAAQNGTDGLTLGMGQGCMVPRGSISNGEWATTVASIGSNGAPGRGGGGGGGGGCVRNANPNTCTIGRLVGDLGGTGGGGGAGGCGGNAGLAAAGGGGSFGIFVVGAPPAIDGNLLDFGFGGFGGGGGAGGYGGLGGQGGRGGPNTSVAWCAGQGGPGGRGGNGGAGSGGGGGCGGSVFGVGGQGIGNLNYQQRNTFPLPSALTGAGGVGGPSPAGLAFKGGDGTPGMFFSVESF